MIDWMKVARPYARAAFEYARDNNVLESWSDMLAEAAKLASVQSMKEIDADPEVDTSVLQKLVLDALAVEDEAQKSYLSLLVDNHKLLGLECIQLEFESMCAEHAKTIDVQVTTAKDLNETQKEQLIKALEDKFKRKVKYTCKTDQDLLGGIIIRAGDTVIDGSGRGRLKQLSEELA